MIKKFNESAEMPDIFTRQIIYSVDASDLATLIEDLYGRDPEIEASLELGHDDTFEISANAMEFNEKDFVEWLKKPSWSRSEISMLMNKLAADGHIVDGDYLIKTY